MILEYKRYYLVRSEIRVKCPIGSYEYKFQK